MWAQAAHPRALSKVLLDWAKDQPEWAWEDELGTDRLSWEDAPPEVDVAREGVKGDAVLHSVLEELDPLTADLVDLLAEEFPIDGTRRDVSMGNSLMESLSMESLSMPSTEPEWYAKGLRFSCTQCGNCCTGAPGIVAFSTEEGENMAKRLEMSVGDFYRRFARKVNGAWSLTERKTSFGYDCVFLDRESNPGVAGCRLYEDRPKQCRTWPFWPENLESPQAWEEAKANTPCPGMGRGTLVPIESIRIQPQRPWVSEAQGVGWSGLFGGGWSLTQRNPKWFVEESGVADMRAEGR